VKLRGRPEAPDWSRGRTISSRARGDTTALHGSLQRLLGAISNPKDYVERHHSNNYRKGHSHPKQLLPP
jgi:hypothetical protein